MSKWSDVAVSGDEFYAYQHAEQYRGCIGCGKSQHSSAFCPECGQCFYCLMNKGNATNTVKCSCGAEFWP